MSRARGKSQGFTLIELMIVVGIIGILAAIALPKYGEMIEKANQGATLGNIAAIRSAVNIYNGEFLRLPETLDTKDPSFANVMADPLPGVKAKYPPAHPPYGNGVTNGISIPDTSGTGWYYDHFKGHVYINSIELDIYGKNYTIY
jgi:prepilin-type N-terminal cleavage/methylation domain-containing protein